MQPCAENKMDVKRMQKLPIIDSQNPSRKFSEKEEKWLREIVNYEFMNLEQPGLVEKFCYGTTSNKMNIILFHGGKYPMPRFLANHVNACSTPMWKWRPDGIGSLRKELIGRNSRFQMREIY